MGMLEDLVARAKAEAKATPASKPASKIWHESVREPDLIPEAYLIKTYTETCPSCGEKNEEFVGLYLRLKGARATVERLVKPIKIEYPRIPHQEEHTSAEALCGCCATLEIETLFLREAKHAPR